MKQSPRKDMALHAAWLLFALAFCFTGLDAIRTAPPRNISTSGPSCSNDTFLALVTGMDHGTERITRFLAPVDSGKTVIYFNYGEVLSSDLLFGVLSSVAWPRPAKLVTVTDALLPPAVSRVDPKTTGALFFETIPPPAALPGVVKLGPHLSAVRIREAAP